MAYRINSHMATLNDIRAKDQNQIRSVDWYRKQVQSLPNTFGSPAGVMRSNLGERDARPEVGSMYLYLYDPKTKKKLPYYDTFPLVLPFEDAKGGFYGLNLHYLPYGLRFELLEQLKRTKNTRTINQDTQFQLSWNLLKLASRFPAVQPTIKRYLYSQIRSRLLKINPQDWSTAAALPVEQFEGASKQTVFNRSRKAI